MNRQLERGRYQTVVAGYTDQQHDEAKREDSAMLVLDGYRAVELPCKKWVEEAPEEIETHSGSCTLTIWSNVWGMLGLILNP